MWKDLVLWRWCQSSGVLGGMRKQGEPVSHGGNKPVSSNPQFLSPGSCFEFLPWIPSVMDFDLKIGLSSPYGLCHSTRNLTRAEISSTVVGAAMTDLAVLAWTGLWDE